MRRLAACLSFAQMGQRTGETHRPAARWHPKPYGLRLTCTACTKANCGHKLQRRMQFSGQRERTLCFQTDHSLRLRVSIREDAKLNSNALSLWPCNARLHGTDSGTSLTQSQRTAHWFYRTFKLARPAIASRAATIQKRMTMRVSGSPRNTK